MVTDQQFNKLIDLCQDLADVVEGLTEKVEVLESISRYQENQINILQEEVFALERYRRYLVKVKYVYN